jgi:hypothetical protein
MTKWFLPVVLFGIATISDHSIAAEISKDQITTLWQSSCNPWVDYNCAAPKISPRALKAMERSGNCDPYLDYKCLDTYLGYVSFIRIKADKRRKSLADPLRSHTMASAKRLAQSYRRALYCAQETTKSALTRSLTAVGHAARARGLNDLMYSAQGLAAANTANCNPG